MGDQGGTSGTGSRTRVIAAVVVSVLVTVSAAGAVGAVAELSDPETSVVDQLATPASEETPPPEFPPGTNESGVTNATALLAANSHALKNTTYTTRLSVEGATATTIGGTPATTGNDSEAERNASALTVTVEKGATGTSVNVVSAGGSAEYWITGNVTATRSVQATGNATAATYLYEERGDGLPDRRGGPDVTPTDVIAPYVSTLDFDYQGTVTRGNDTLHRFTATGVDRRTDAVTGELPGVVENTSATLLVSERGVIRHLDVSMQYTRNNQTVATQLRYSVDNLGNTTTTEPAWLADQLPRFNASLTENGSVVALEYTDGPDLSNGTQSPTGVLVSTPSGDAYTTFNASLEPGDTVYLWNASGGPELNSSVNDPPAVDESFTAFSGERVSVAVARLQPALGVDGDTKSLIVLDVRVANGTVTNSGETAENGKTTAASDGTTTATSGGATTSSETATSSGE
ncbi:hypothetical protein [Halobacterium zhouii]|uniref:hypothetical protein n=1 Tax=Halobacterium zhouii TaxID=2902624 RepID=UPI001E3D55D1|nr:hypothetical protein [Halobacterium zhouii]